MASSEFDAACSEQAAIGERPLVSVVMPVHNQGRILLQAIDSVLAQTLLDIELVIWDDGSTNPETQGLLASLQAQHGSSEDVRVFRAGINRGVIHARNSAARLSRGEMLLFLDPDDTIHPTYLEKAYLALKGLPQRQVCSSRVTLVGHPSQAEWVVQPLTWPLAKYTNLLPISSVIRREAFFALGGFRQEFVLGYEDWDLWARVAAVFGDTSVVLPEPLFRYTYSETAGRDAESARLHAKRLKKMIRRTRCQHVSVPKPEPHNSVSQILASLRRRSSGPSLPASLIIWSPSSIAGLQRLMSLSEDLRSQRRELIVLVPDSMKRVPAVVQGDLLCVYPLADFLHECDYLPFTLHLAASTQCRDIFILGDHQQWSGSLSGLGLAVAHLE